MSLSTERAGLVAGQVARFVTHNRHQLVGQVSNLDFWLVARDGYGVRFIRMHTAQEHYVTTHQTTEFAIGADYPTGKKASPPRRVPDREIQKARRALVESTRRFLERGRKDGFISEAKLSVAIKHLGIE